MALAASLACFFRREFVGRAFFMRGTSAFAGDFTLLGRVHGSETPFAGIALLVAAAAARFAALFIVARCSHDGLLGQTKIKQKTDFHEKSTTPHGKGNLILVRAWAITNRTVT